MIVDSSDRWCGVITSQKFGLLATHVCISAIGQFGIAGFFGKNVVSVYAKGRISSVGSLGKCP